MNTEKPSKLPEIDILDYDLLYREYQQGLVDKLRGFGPTQEFLALWVPSEDAHQGIWNLFDAVSSSGGTQVFVELGEETQKQVEIEQLIKELRCFGTPQYSLAKDRILLWIEDLRRPNTTGLSVIDLDSSLEQAEVRQPLLSWKAPVDPYAHKISRHNKERQHQRPPESGAEAIVEQDQDCIEVEYDGIRFWVIVDHKDASIVDCGYVGGADSRKIGGLEAWCRQCLGRPLRDALEHGVLLAEFSLREERDARPVAGVVLSDNADPLFSWLNEIVAALRQQCRLYSQDWAQSYNEYDSGPGIVWAKTSEVERKKLILEILAEFCQEHQELSPVIQFSQLQFDIRVVVDLQVQGVASLRAEVATQLERRIRDRLDPRLELYLEEKRDRNKNRRLSVISTPKKIASKRSAVKSEIEETGSP